MNKETKRFLVSLSFPGEKRSYVKKVYEALINELPKEAVFYDESFTHELARPNLDTYLQNIYHDESCLIVVFLCEEYEQKEWCGLELRAIRDLIKKKKDYRIMFFRFDGALIPGIYSIDGFIDISNVDDNICSNLIIRRLSSGARNEESREFEIPHSKWMHETTDDVRYIKRNEILALEKWVDSSSVRVISITGMGGTGKTSMVGNWLKGNECTIKKSIYSLFYWSFYSERRVSAFLRCLCEFFEDCYNLDLKLDKRNPFEAFLIAVPQINRFLKQLPTKNIALVILDGLEVLQEALSEGRSYGAFIDAQLRDFVLTICQSSEYWLCITTSRFPITDLNTYSEAKHLNLKGVSPKEGADILLNYGISGHINDRQKISSFLDGHPLAILLFASSIPDEFRSKPKIHLANIFGENINNKFSEKIERLLEFYRSSLNDIQRATISALSLFRTPVSNEIIKNLVPNYLQEDKGLDSVSSEILFELGRLSSSGLLIKDAIKNKSVYACHPIIRDFFRKYSLDENYSASRLAVDYLTSRPDDNPFESVSNIEQFLISIEILLDIGDYNHAVELYVQRLNKGAIFLTAEGLAREGKRCYERFERFHEKVKISSHRVYYPELDQHHYTNGLIEFCLQLGEYHDAERYIELSIIRSPQNRKPIPLRANGRLALDRGDFVGVERACLTAVNIEYQYITPQNGLADALARTLFILVQNYLCQGLDEKANSTINLLKGLNSFFETAFSDSLLRLQICHLVLGLKTKNTFLIKKYINKCIERLKNVKDHYFLLEAKLLISESCCSLKDFGKARLYAREVYDEAVRFSYPYMLCRSIFLEQYSAYLESGSCVNARVREIIEIARASEMKILQIDASILYSKVSDDKIDIFNEIRELCDSTGYVPRLLIDI